MGLNKMNEEYTPEKLPCINCMLVPMCKGIIDSYKQRYSHINNHRDVILLVYKKCSLLRDYVFEGSLYEGMPFENIHLLSIALRYITHNKLPEGTMEKYNESQGEI
jgi:hypothetical protein